MASFLAIEALAGVQPGWSPQQLALMLLWATGGQVALLPTGMTYPYPPVSLLPPSAASMGGLPAGSQAPCTSLAPSSSQNRSVAGRFPHTRRIGEVSLS